MPKPVARARHHVAVIAEDRQGVGGDGARGHVHDRRASARPAILYMLGIISSRPCDAVKVVVSDPAWRAPCTAPAAPALALHLDIGPFPHGRVMG
jgi:hypothetical protein